MNLTFGQKFMIGLFGVQFFGSFLKEYKKSNSKLSDIEIEFLTKEIINCSIYQTLIKEGKSPKEISDILDIKNMNPKKFHALTGKNWPQ